MNIFRIVYLLYFLITVTAIHLTARILAKTTAIFLSEADRDGEKALQVNRVIIASFFLANVGFAVSNLPTYLDHATPGQGIALLLDKLGAAMLFNGFTLFLGLWIFARMRRLGAPASTTR